MVRVYVNNPRLAALVPPVCACWPDRKTRNVGCTKLRTILELCRATAVFFASHEL